MLLCWLFCLCQWLMKYRCELLIFWIVGIFSLLILIFLFLNVYVLSWIVCLNVCWVFVMCNLIVQMFILYFFVQCVVNELGLVLIRKCICFCWYSVMFLLMCCVIVLNLNCLKCCVSVFGMGVVNLMNLRLVILSGLVVGLVMGGVLLDNGWELLGILVFGGMWLMGICVCCVWYVWLR